MTGGKTRPLFIFRFYTYLVERFSLFAVLFSCGLQYLFIIYYTTGKLYQPNGYKEVVGFLSFFFFLVILRLFDEIKDKDHDDQYHKERPVQRGLIDIGEIKLAAISLSVFIFLINLPFVLSFSFWIFGLAFLYLLMMRFEFFVPQFLKPRLILYLLTHQLFVPILVSYLIYLNGGSIKSWRDVAFLFLNLLLVMSIEVARKIRSSAEENPSRDTYSAYLGKNGALAFLFLIAFASDLFFIKIFSKSSLILLNLLLLVFSFLYYRKKDSALSSKLVLASMALLNFLNVLVVIL